MQPSFLSFFLFLFLIFFSHRISPFPFVYTHSFCVSRMIYDNGHSFMRKSSNRISGDLLYPYKSFQQQNSKTYRHSWRGEDRFTSWITYLGGLTRPSYFYISFFLTGDAVPTVTQLRNWKIVKMSKMLLLNFLLLLLRVAAVSCANSFILIPGEYF